MTFNMNSGELFLWNAFGKKSVVKLHSLRMTSGTNLFLWAKKPLNSVRLGSPPAFACFGPLYTCSITVSNKWN